MSEPGKLAILGSTGTIGQATLELVRLNPERFKVVSLSANHNTDLLKQQIEEFGPKLVALPQQEIASKLEQALGPSETEIVSGKEALIAAVSDPEIHTVVVGITGYAALEPLLAAIEKGVHIALANKESMVAAGHLVNQALAQSSSKLIPVDSEHNSLFQLLENVDSSEISGLTITASGGPFLNKKADEMWKISVAEAVNHPRWNMGAKISVDSATLMNKGLEVIEAIQLFSLPESRIDVLVHPQSIVHALVNFVDGSQTALLYQPDMKLPIGHAIARLSAEGDPQLAEPEKKLLRLSKIGVPRLDLTKTEPLEFFEPDNIRFPSLKLCREASRRAGPWPCILNAANEIAVAGFLDNKIRFPQIAEVVDSVLKLDFPLEFNSFQEVKTTDSWAREHASKFCNKFS